MISRASPHRHLSPYILIDQIREILESIQPINNVRIWMVGQQFAQ